MNEAGWKWRKGAAADCGQGQGQRDSPEGADQNAASLLESRRVQQVRGQRYPVSETGKTTSRPRCGS